MELEQYCDNFAAELTGWRHKFGEVVRKFDQTATGDKSNVYQHINELHMILEEFEERIRELKASCAAGVEPNKFEVEGKFTGFRPIYRDVWQDVSPGDIGG
jgi:predicted RNase H-like nuclease (RuvC/YqgF family)